MPTRKYQNPHHRHNETHCKRGHELNLANKQHQRCKICDEIDMQEKKKALLAKTAKLEDRTRQQKYFERLKAEAEALRQRKEVDPRCCDYPDLHPASKENTTKAGLCALCSAARRIGRKPHPKKQFCKRGHELTPENTMPLGGCRICHSQKSTQWNRDHKELVDARRRAKVINSPATRKRIRGEYEDFLYWSNQIRESWKDGIRPLFRPESDEEVRRIFANAPPLSGRSCKRARQLEEGDTERSVCSIPPPPLHGRVAVEPRVQQRNERVDPRLFVRDYFQRAWPTVRAFKGE